MLRLISKSLSIKLVFIFAVLSALFAYGAMVSVRWLFDTDALRELVSEHLSLHVDYVRADIGNPPRVDRALAITRRVPVDIRLAGPGVEWASDPAFPRVDELEFGDSDIFSDQPDAWLDELDDVEFAREGHHSFLKISQGPYAIVVSTPKIADQRIAFDLRIVIVGLGLALLMLGYLAVRWLFRPIKQIREGAVRIGRGELDHRIDNTRHDELGELANEVNAMADDVQAMLEAKRQLLLGISHELRTPLSRMRLGLEFVESEAERRTLRDEITEMEAIIGTLLGAESLGMRHAALQLEAVAIAELLDELVREYFQRDAERIELRMDDRGIQAHCDPARVMLMLKNLISNALRYSPPEKGPIVVATREEGDDLVFVVSDHGPGLDPEHAQRIWEPFYRGDPSRDRETGGSGLGLYLARMIAEAHGGTISLDPQYRDGARFVVRMPVV